MALHDRVTLADSDVATRQNDKIHEYQLAALAARALAMQR
jgi:hypothetical protein